MCTKELAIQKIPLSLKEHTYYFDLTNEESGWQILGGKLPLGENPSLINTGMYVCIQDKLSYRFCTIHVP